jgi:XTP/dITP diphosphohydrolase
MPTLYIATSNPGKLRDFASAHLPPGVKLLPLPGLDRIPPPVEDEDTFAGNACLKAIAYSLEAPGVLVLADDSGLEVDAPDGAPGVHSARYAKAAGFANPGKLPIDALNNQYLLQQLADVPPGKRTARYHCVLAAARDGSLLALSDGTGPALGHGTVEGLILTEPRGSGGFGYDPLFLLLDHGRTMAEVPLEEKLKFSHRGRALASLLGFLETTVV